jgi:hypothetical protein
MKIRMVMTIITMYITKHIYICKQYESDPTRYEPNMQALEITDFGEPLIILNISCILKHHATLQLRYYVTKKYYITNLLLTKRKAIMRTVPSSPKPIIFTATNATSQVTSNSVAKPSRRH